jgi:hypothetical protein
MAIKRRTVDHRPLRDVAYGGGVESFLLNQVEQSVLFHQPGSIHAYITMVATMVARLSCPRVACATFS